MGKAQPTPAGLQAAREALEKTPKLVRGRDRDGALLALAHLYDKIGDDRFRLIVGLRPPSNPIEAASVDLHFGRITSEQFREFFEAEYMRPVDRRMLDVLFTALDERVVAYNATLAEVYRQGHAIETGVLTRWNPDAFDSHPWKEPLPLTSNEVQTVGAFLGEVRIERNLGPAEMAGYSEPSAASLAFRIFDLLQRLFQFVTENTIDYGNLPEVYRYLRAGRLPNGVDLQSVLSWERSAALVVLRDRAKPAPTFPETITVNSLTVQSQQCDVTAESANVSASRVEGLTESTPVPNVLRRNGDAWIATYASHTTNVKPSLGLVYIAHLIARKGRSIDALALQAATAGLPEPATQVESEVSDDQALAECRSEYEDLQEQLEEAQEHNDLMRQEAIRSELLKLSEYLFASKGLGGRTRRFLQDASRARVAVKNAISRVLAKLEEGHPDLATHLDRSIQTGQSLCYSPSPDVTWEL